MLGKPEEAPGIAPGASSFVNVQLAKKGTYYFRMQFAGTTSFAPCQSKSVKVVSK